MTYPQQPQQPQQQPPPAYYGPQPPLAPAPKKTKKWPWVVGIIVALIVIGSIANGGKTPNTTPAAGTTGAAAPAAPVENVAPVEQPAAAKVKTVVYEVTGTGTAGNITYTTDGMTSTEQVSDVPLPWSKTIELPVGEALQIVQVLAQNGGDGEITATITVDGKVVKTGKSSGAYAVVSVNESIGTLGNK